VALAILAWPAAARGQVQFGVDAFGASYHYNTRTFVDNEGRLRSLKQINPGVGLAAIVRESPRSIVELHAAIYTDSLGGSTGIGGVIWQAKFAKRLRAGVAAMVMITSPEGVLAAPLPIVSCQVRRVTFSAVWIPSFGRYISGAVGTFATIRLK
jgi:hypothetical protein